MRFFGLLIFCLNVIISTVHFRKGKKNMKKNDVNLMKIKKKRMTESELKDNIQLFTMLIPAILKIFVFAYIPMVGIVLAFKNYDFSLGIFGSPWVGFQNFEFFFKSNDAVRILKNTICMNTMFIITGNLGAVTLAVMLYQVMKGKMIKVYQTVSLFPNFLSWIVVGILLDNIIGSRGMITGILDKLGISLDFYSMPEAWNVIMPIMNLWKSGGYFALIYFGILMATDSTLYEAAEIDGANSWQIITRLQIPCLIPMVMLQTITAIGRILSADFGMFYFLPGANNALTYETTDVLSTYVFRMLTGNANLSLGAAVGLFTSFVGMILVIITNKLARKYNENYALY